MSAFVVSALWYALLFIPIIIVCRARYQQRLERRKSLIDIVSDVDVDERPFVSFGGSGLAFGYYLGVAKYLTTHFVTDNVRFGGVSGGVIALLHSALGFDIEAIFVVLLRYRARLVGSSIWSTLSAYFQTCEAFLESAVPEIYHFCQADDEEIEIASEEDRVCIGVTDTSSGMASHITKMSSVKELMTALCASACILPFFKKPVTIGNKNYVDGCFSQHNVVPQNAHKDKVVRVNVVPCGAECDIAPKKPIRRSSLVLHLGMETHAELFQQGYNDAHEKHELFCQKGLVPKRSRRPSLIEVGTEIEAVTSTILNAEEKIGTGYPLEFGVSSHLDAVSTPSTVCSRRRFSNVSTMSLS